MELDATHASASGFITILEELHTPKDAASDHVSIVDTQKRTQQYSCTESKARQNLLNSLQIFLWTLALVN